MHVCVFVLQKTAFRRIYCTCAVFFVSMCFVFSTIIIIVLCTFLFSKLFISFRSCIRFRCWVQQIFTAYRSLFFMCSIFFPSIIGCLFVCFCLMSTMSQHDICCVQTVRDSNIYSCERECLPSQTLLNGCKSTKISNSHSNACTHAQFVYPTAF